MDRTARLKEEEQERQYPRIRPVDADSIAVMGKTMILLSDPARISTKTLMITPGTYHLISLLDGTRTIEEIQSAYNRDTGVLLFANQLMDIIFELDCAMMMDNIRFHQYMDFLKSQFRESSLREPAMAGRDYPENPDELKFMLDRIFAENAENTDDGRIPSAVASPHIDFARGGPLYASAYREVKKMDCDTFVILGTSHNPTENLLALTKKTFRTPFGDLPADESMISMILQNSAHDWLLDEFAHRGEHSVEFQAVMLKYIFPDKDIKILPILAGAPEYLKKGGTGEHSAQLTDFLNAFERTVMGTDRRIGFIAGADLAHVGPRFGDTSPPDRLELEFLGRRDRESMEFLEKGDSEGFLKDVMKDQDKRRICGVSPLYLMSLLLGRFSGRLIDYRQCGDSDCYNTVTIGSASFYGTGPDA